MDSISPSLPPFISYFHFPGTQNFVFPPVTLRSTKTQLSPRLPPSLQYSSTAPNSFSQPPNFPLSCYLRFLFHCLLYLPFLFLHNFSFVLPRHRALELFDLLSFLNFLNSRENIASASPAEFPIKSDCWFLLLPPSPFPSLSLNLKSASTLV